MTRTDLLEAEHAALTAFLRSMSTDEEIAAWDALEDAHTAVERGAPIEPSNTITRSRNGR